MNFQPKKEKSEFGRIFFCDNRKIEERAARRRSSPPYPIFLFPPDVVGFFPFKEGA